MVFNKNYYGLCLLSNRFIAACIFDLFRRLNFLNKLITNKNSLTQVFNTTGLDSCFVRYFDWMLGFLIENKYCINKDNFLVFNKEDFLTIEKTRNELLEVDPNMSNFCRLTEKAADAYESLFLGKGRGMELLFSSGGILLWNNYFSNDNPGYRVYNDLIAEILITKFLLIEKSKKFEILELGGGGASAASAVLKKIAEEKAGARIKMFRFSDITPSFVRGFYRRVENKFLFPFETDAIVLDFNSDIAEQLNKRSSDIIYAVNALHAAKNLEFTLTSIYNSLSRGGHLLISECIRSEDFQYPFQEFIFNLLDSYWDVEKSNNRLTTGFLSINQWKNLFMQAGFTKITSYTNVDYTDGAGGSIPVLSAVITGEK